MRVYGLDFTSSPTDKKRLTLAVCTLVDGVLCVDNLKSLNTDREGDLSAFEDFLNGVGEWSKEDEWVAGLDFPFGLPVAAIAHFAWLGEEAAQDWTTWLSRMYELHPTLTDFQDRIESWKRINKNNKLVKMHIKRQTDQLAGSNVSSPLKVRDNPPVGSMFYVGARLLLASGACVVPVRVNDSKRRAIEAYPVIAVNRLVGHERYKEANKDGRQAAAEVRKDIVDRLSRDNPYAIVVRFLRDHHRTETIDDHAGDKLDSVLCAVQAAWSVTHNHGMPSLTPKCLQDTVRLEGWIADPALLSHFE
jgi:hypothetical protein